MSTDFERRLSALLQDTTPEPPDELAAPTAATLTGRGETADADVIELGQERDLRPGRRWAPLVAAAAVVAIGGGIAAVAGLGSSHGHTPVGTHTSPSALVTQPTKIAGLHQCRNRLVLADLGTTTEGDLATSVVRYRNFGDRACSLTLPSVSIGSDATGGAPVAGPANADTPIRLEPDGRVLIRTIMRTDGTCRTVNRGGLNVNLTTPDYASDGSETDSLSVGLADCGVTPVGWAFSMVRR